MHVVEQDGNTEHRETPVSLESLWLLPLPVCSVDTWWA